jgi:hypothetical protein
VDGEWKVGEEMTNAKRRVMEGVGLELVGAG